MYIKGSRYVYALRRYERRRKMQKLGWFGGLGITQGHRKRRRHLIERIYDFLFDLETMRLCCAVFEL